MYRNEFDQACIINEIKPGNVRQGMTKEQVLDDYKDVFTGIGLFPGEYRITVNPDVKPVIHTARKVPFALQKRLKEELQDMQKKDVIAPVEKPTEWVSSLVVVEKRESGKLRICLDPRDLIEQ